MSSDLLKTLNPNTGRNIFRIKLDRAFKIKHTYESYKIRTATHPDILPKHGIDGLFDDGKAYQLNE